AVILAEGPAIGEIVQDLNGSRAGNHSTAVQATTPSPYATQSGANQARPTGTSTRSPARISWVFRPRWLRRSGDVLRLRRTSTVSLQRLPPPSGGCHGGHTLITTG